MMRAAPKARPKVVDAPVVDTETAAMRILVVEDNPKMALAVKQALQEQGYGVDIAETGSDGEQLAIIESYDIIVLDVMLPDRDGVEVCRRLRKRGLRTPVLMLTALSTTTDKVAGLDAGADDYLPKPFEFDELLARIRALLRRGEATESSVLRYEDIEMDLLRRKVQRGGKEVKLTQKEFALVEFLLRNPDRVLTRTTIGEKVWDMNFDPASNVIDVYISTLRRKMDRGFERELIHTVIGSGYMFSAQPPG